MHKDVGNPSPVDNQDKGERNDGVGFSPSTTQVNSPWQYLVLKCIRNDVDESVSIFIIVL